MFNTIVCFIGRLIAGPEKPTAPKMVLGVGRHRPSYQHAMFIRKVIDSNIQEGQIETSIEWVHRLYRKGFLPVDTYHELIHHAMYKEEQIITERVKRDFICPHVKKRADEIIEEERRKNIRIIKTEVK
jgi:hypothetical protein